MDDLISRQAAIEETWKEPSYTDPLNVLAELRDRIKDLPSAQPEIVRCDKCKHGVHSGRGNVYICHISPELVMEHTGDFYCGYAERRTDERTD